MDLNPVGVSGAEAYGVSDGQQVGYIYDSASSNYHAALWRGTAASWVDLNPAGATVSYALGVHSNQQVGYARVAGITRASLWSGTAASWVDLNVFLPANYSGSAARGIWHGGGLTYVVGSGFSSTGEEALMWIGPSPQISAKSPTSIVTATTTTLNPGIVVSGMPGNMDKSNDVYYVLRPGIVLSSTQSPIVLNASYTLFASSARTLELVLESRALNFNEQQTIQVYNFSSGSYDLLNQQVLPTSAPDTVISSALTPPSNYIGVGNEVRLKFSYKAVGPTVSYPWRVVIDEATLRFVP